MTRAKIDNPDQSPDPLRKIVFFFELPQPIAIPNGSTINFQLGDVVPELQGIPMRVTKQLPPYPEHMTGKMFVSFRLWQIEYQQTVTFGQVFDAMRRGLPVNLRPRAKNDDAPPAVESYRTVVEAVTIIRSTDLSDEGLSRVLDRCCESLDELRLAYQATVGDAIQPINRLRLPFVVPYVTSDLVSERWDESISWVFLHANPPAYKPRSPLEAKEITHLFGMHPRHETTS